MREFEFLFDKGLRTGLRRFANNPRGNQALVECHNLAPAESGLELHEAVVDLNVASYSWSGRGKLDFTSIVIEDTYIAQNTPQGTYGSTIVLALGYGGPTDNQRFILVRPIVMPPYPPYLEISSAELYLYCYDKDGANTHVCPAYRVLLDWDETTASWSYYKQTTEWNLAGCQAAPGLPESVAEDSIYDRYDFAAEDTTNVTGVGWFSWDLTALCQKWFNHEASQYGVLIETNQAVEGQKCFFRSYQYSDADYRPYLELS